MIKKVTLKIYGLVQGIGYRYLGQREAKKLGLAGYIRNLANGSVEIIAEGEEEKLKDFIEWCYNGVGTAQVKEIEQDWSDKISNLEDFVIKF